MKKKKISHTDLFEPEKEPEIESKIILSRYAVALQSVKDCNYYNDIFQTDDYNEAKKSVDETHQSTKRKVMLFDRHDCQFVYEQPLIVEESKKKDKKHD